MRKAALDQTLFIATDNNFAQVCFKNAKLSFETR